MWISYNTNHGGLLLVLKFVENFQVFEYLETHTMYTGAFMQESFNELYKHICVSVCVCILVYMWYFTSENLFSWSHIYMCVCLCVYTYLYTTNGGVKFLGPLNFNIFQQFCLVPTIKSQPFLYILSPNVGSNNVSESIIRSFPEIPSLREAITLGTLFDHGTSKNYKGKVGQGKMGVKYNTISRNIPVVACHNYKNLKVRLACSLFLSLIFKRMHIFVTFTKKFSYNIITKYLILILYVTLLFPIYQYQE